jgi:hypothetical protein
MTIELSEGRGTLERGDDDKWIVKSEGKTYTINVADDGRIMGKGAGSRLKKNTNLCEAVEAALINELGETLSVADDPYGDLTINRGRHKLSDAQNNKRAELYGRMFEFAKKHGNSEAFMQILREYYGHKHAPHNCQVMADQFDRLENPAAEFDALSEKVDDFSDLLS